MAATRTASARKPGPAAKAKPAPQPPAAAAAPQKEKARKPKLVRDSFTMPEAEYEALADIKKACLKAGVAVKKSELLRIGVAMVRNLDAAAIERQLARLVQLKAGRPRKEK